LPNGIQAVMTEGVEDEQALMAWELDNESAVFALLAGNAEAEGLEPSTIDEMKTWPDWPKWEDAINAKLKSLDDAHTWNVVERPKDTNVMSCKWVFKIKKNTAGEINKYKARLVTCSFMQQYGVDYDETYAPVARLAHYGLSWRSWHGMTGISMSSISTARFSTANSTMMRSSTWNSHPVSRSKVATWSRDSALPFTALNRVH